MMQKRLKPFIIGEPAKFASALIAIDDRWNPFMNNPIKKGKNRQAQTICKRDQNDADNHDQASHELVEIFRSIELPALANRAALENQ